MKAICKWSFLACTVLAGAIPKELDKRQLGGLIGSLASISGGTARQATVLKTLKPEYSPNATRALYLYGPYKLASRKAKHDATGMGISGIKLDPNSDTLGGNIIPPCKDCTVYKAMANFAYKDGRQVDVSNGVYVHHIILPDFAGKSQLNPPVQDPCGLFGGGKSGAGGMSGMSGMSHGPTRRNVFDKLSKRQFGLSVFIGGGGSGGSGNPFSPKPGSNIKSGYWIGKSGNMKLSSEVINYDDVEKEIYLTLDVEWTPGRDPDMLDVGMGAINANTCGGKSLDLMLPPKDKPIEYKGDIWNIIDNGWFINFTPHLHDGAVNIKVFVNDKEVCESKAIYGQEGGTTNAPDGEQWQTITGYTPCDTPILIKKGDKAYVSSLYDLTKHRLRPMSGESHGEAEAMAIATFIFAKPFPK